MLLVIAAASAATVTDLPPFLRGDLSVAYGFDYLGGSLTERGEIGEEDTTVANRVVSDHTLRYGLTFSVAPGAAVSVEIPHTVYRAVDVSEWSRMVYDPATGSGTYVGTATEEDATVSKGSGIGGVWLGVKGTPFSEAFVGRQTRFTWLLEGAVRTPNEDNQLVVVTPGEGSSIGTRGAGPGGVGLRVASTFSSRRGRTEPYLRLAIEENLPHEIDVLADNGEVLAKNVSVDPANRFEAVVGAEFIAAENSSSGARTAIDLRLSAGWQSYQDVPTGLELPAVLIEDAGLVQQAENMEIGGGLGLDFRFMKYLQLQLWGDARYHLPQRLESPYPVYTGGDTVHVAAGSKLTIRVR
jgi:hypothetical protein